MLQHQDQGVKSIAQFQVQVFLQFQMVTDGEQRFVKIESSKQIAPHMAQQSNPKCL
jgi:hypothetical protein